MSPEEFRTVRRLLIACVLATDMTKHGEIVTQASDKLDNMAEDHTFFLSTLIHAADISHPCRPWEMHEHWTQMVAEEFFQQGDAEKELGLEVSFLCDRDTVEIPKSQVGFINFAIMPLFMVLVEKIPEMDPMIKNINENRSKWEELVREDD